MAVKYNDFLDKNTEKKNDVADAASTINIVKTYLKEASKYKPLPREEEKILAEAAAQGDENAKKELINHNLLWVASVAKQYMGRGMAFMDLIQEGNLGLIKAADKYDVTKGFRFSTYATYWIKQSISRAIMNQGRNIRVPVHTVELIGKIKKVENEFQQKNGRKPQVKEVAAILDINITKIKEAYTWMKDTTSLDITIGDDADDGVAVGSFVEDAAATESFAIVEDNDRSFIIKKVLSTLDEREAFVIERRFGLGRERAETLEEIGQELRLSRERIRQIEIDALRKLRNPRRIKLLKEFVDF